MEVPWYVEATKKLSQSGSMNVTFMIRYVELLNRLNCFSKGGSKSEEAGGFLHLQDKYSKSLSWAENLNFPPKSVNNLFKFSAQDCDLEYLFWRTKNPPVSSDLKPPLVKKEEIIVIDVVYGWPLRVWPWKIIALSSKEGGLPFTGWNSFWVN